MSVASQASFLNRLISSGCPENIAQMAWRVYSAQNHGAPTTIKLSKNYKQGSTEDIAKKLTESIIRVGQGNGLNVTRQSVNQEHSSDFNAYAGSLARMLSQDQNISLHFAYGLPVCTFNMGKGKYGVDSKGIEAFAQGISQGTGFLDKAHLFGKNQYSGAAGIDKAWNTINQNRSLTGKNADADAMYLEDALKLYYQVSATGNTQLDSKMNDMFNVVRTGVQNDFNKYRDRLVSKGTNADKYPNLYRWLRESMQPSEFEQAMKRLESTETNVR